MKKIIYTIVFSFTLYVSGLFAQSNITWTVKDKIEKGALKSMTVFNSSFSGFTSKEESAKFYQNLKTNPELASCDLINSTNNSCDLKITMKRAHDKHYFIALFSKLGVSSVSANGNKKTFVEWGQGNKK